jgi:hypothetical protein
MRDVRASIKIIKINEKINLLFSENPLAMTIHESFELNVLWRFLLHVLVFLSRY